MTYFVRHGISRLCKYASKESDLDLLSKYHTESLPEKERLDAYREFYARRSKDSQQSVVGRGLAGSLVGGATGAAIAASVGGGRTKDMLTMGVPLAIYGGIVGSYFSHANNEQAKFGKSTLKMSDKELRASMRRETGH